MDAEATFVLRMRQRREGLGMSQKRLAHEVSFERGWTEQSAIARMEKGQRRVTLNDALALARALSCPLDVLLLPVTCDACKDNPPAGFTCSQCGTAA